MQLMEEVEALSKDELVEQIKTLAKGITKETQGDSWDDPEQWQLEAAVLAHSVVKLFRDKIKLDY